MKNILPNMEFSKIDVVKEALKECSAALGLQPSVDVVGIKNGFKVILAFVQDPAYPDFGRNMIKLERAMKKYQGCRNISLECESIDDKNKRDIKHGLTPAKLFSERGIESLDQ